MKKKKSTKEIFIELAKPDADGFSEPVLIEELQQAGLGLGLGLGLGGSWCRDDGPLGKTYNVFREIKKNKIIAVSLHGFKKAGHVINKAIPSAIKKAIQNQKCAVLFIGDVEVDHKDGHRDNLGDVSKLTTNDFQPLSKEANNAKRQHCKVCRKTKKRFDATLLGYAVGQVKGGSKYMGSCIGCYWYDPHQFNSAFQLIENKQR